MTAPAIAAEERLTAVLSRETPLAIAVSGGVDSMTLAFIAHRRVDGQIAMIHAVSPAVPPEATARVRRYAERESWQLIVTNAGEFDDPAYRANPVGRCYFCKSHLYDRIGVLWDGAIASGTNLDDIDDYRPGLVAAAERRVLHPYVEAGVDKTMVRALARHYRLDDLAELPAQPCLASRIETGIAIDADDLRFVNIMEEALAPLLPRGTAIRCRITRAGARIEIGDPGSCDPKIVEETARAIATGAGRRFAGLAPYRMGSAFLRHSDEGIGRAAALAGPRRAKTGGGK